MACDFILVKGSATIAREQSHISRYKAARKAPKGHPFNHMPKGGSPLTKHIVLRLTLPNIISHMQMMADNIRAMVSSLTLPKLLLVTISIATYVELALWWIPLGPAPYRSTACHHTEVSALESFYL